MSQELIKIPESEYMHSGHLACPGCGGTLAMRYVLKALGKNTIFTMPACCWSVIDGPMPYTSLSVPLYHTAFETAAAAASGIRAALEIKNKKETTVVAWAGDGGTFDIGIQALSGAAERNDDFIYICYDNEAYMNTGIQRSSATPWGAWTTTTPYDNPKAERKKNIDEIMAAHKIPYAATATVAFPEDLIKKVEKAMKYRGTKFLHILSPCPPGWKTAPELTIKMSRLAIECKVFPLMEIEDGEKYILNYEPQGRPVKEYIRLQERFKHLTDEDIEKIQIFYDKEWEKLMAKVKSSSS